MSPWRKWRCKLSQRGQLGEGRRGKRNKQQKQKQLRTCKSSANLAFCVPRLRFNASRLGVVVVVVCCAGQQLQFHFRSLAFYSLFWPARRVCSRRFVYFRYFRLFSRNKYFRLLFQRQPQHQFLFQFLFLFGLVFHTIGCCTDFRADTVKFLHKLCAESLSNWNGAKECSCTCRGVTKCNRKWERRQLQSNWPRKCKMKLE